MLLLECPRCRNRMKYQPAKASGNKGKPTSRLGGDCAQSASADLRLINPADDVSKKIKKCVYCNFSIQVPKGIVAKI